MNREDLEQILEEVESQEGLKLHGIFKRLAVALRVFVESQEGLKPAFVDLLSFDLLPAAVESQEGLKQVNPRIYAFHTGAALVE